MNEEIPDWEELSEDEKESLREVVRGTGMIFPDEDDDEYFE